MSSLFATFGVSSCVHDVRYVGVCVEAGPAWERERGRGGREGGPEREIEGYTDTERERERRRRKEARREGGGGTRDRQTDRYRDRQTKTETERQVHRQKRHSGRDI